MINLKSPYTAIIFATITFALILFYSWNRLSATNLGNGKYLLKWKNGFKFGGRTIDVAQGNFSTITLSNGASIVPTVFDNYVQIELQDSSGKILQTIKIS